MNTGISRTFFEHTCHAPLSRRRLLIGSAALLAGSVPGVRVAGAEPDDGRSLVQRYGTAPEDPWAVAHGIRAMGRSFTVRGGRRAVDHLLEDVLGTLPANGTPALGFSVDVEGHTNAFLKTLLEAGVPLEHPFTHQGTPRTLGDVVDGARALFRPDPVMSVPNALPWSVIAFTRTTSPVRRQWTNAWGERVDLDAVVERALQLLERASRPLVQEMRANRDIATRAPVHSFTCGGTHMLYALLSAVDAGYVATGRVERVQQQVDVLVWRLGADIKLIEQFYGQHARRPGRWWFELDTKLKLLGHAEECLALAARGRHVTLTGRQQAQRRAAASVLRGLLEELGRHDLGKARALNPELFRQLIGDICHARHGLTLA